MTNQQMYSNKYVQSPHVSVTPMTIIIVSYNRNKINYKTTVQKGMIKPLVVLFDFLWSYNTKLYYH